MKMLQTLIDAGREAQRTGSWNEAVAHYEAALALLPAGSDIRARAELLRWIGIAHAERGDLDQASCALHASRIAAESAGAITEEAEAHSCLGRVELLRGNPDAASKAYLRARDLSIQAGNDGQVMQIDRKLRAIAETTEM